MCYTRLQGVIKDFRGLQAVTMVTEGYKGLKVKQVRNIPESATN